MLWVWALLIVLILAGVVGCAVWFVSDPSPPPRHRGEPKKE